MLDRDVFVKYLAYGARERKAGWQLTKYDSTSFNTKIFTIEYLEAVKWYDVYLHCGFYTDLTTYS